MLRLDTDLQIEIEQFLYHEARLLEDDLYHEWLDLLTEDIQYEMPVRESIQGRKSDVVDADVRSNDGLRFALYDDDKRSLLLRVQRLDTGMAYAETPRSITQRLITNVQIESGETPDDLRVASNFLVLQVRHDKYESTFVGKRFDVLRREEGAWRIARRRIELAQPILPRTISIFF